MNDRELRRWLARQDKNIVFENHKSGSGHVTVIRGDRTTQIPTHGGKKELGTGLVNKIKRDLGFE